MALPVAHGLLGAAVAALFQPKQVAERSHKTMITAALLAITPDLDYLFYRGLEWGESWHRSFSHSLLFAVVAGLLAGFLVGPVKTRSFVIYSLATFTHPILDAVISEDPSGVQLLWPLSDRVFSFGLGNYYDSVLRSHPTLGEVVWRVLAISAVELLVFGPILLGAIRPTRGVRGYQEEESPQSDTPRR